MPKPPGRRQRRNTKGLKVGGGRLLLAGDIPSPPTGLLKATREQWRKYWESPVAEAVDRSSDMPAVERLFQLCDERLRAYRGYRKERLVEGSQGQPVLNPLASVIQKCDQEIRALEDRLGLNPKARLQLGITMTEAKRTLEDMNRDLEPDWDEDDDEGEESARAAG